MTDETREYLLGQRGKLLFQIERTKHHLAGLEADEVKIITAKSLCRRQISPSLPRISSSI
ncbi:hypothetical protein [Rhizobium leucaenae]|uniref:Uncharacterized protein n=2 Tax=Rhizobium leucaenae TaxID=29450 RepID=A0A7W6ZQA9_9HYPH|nr:hypothetical protein [Rhizobium leucaenae]MBB4566756.1 hypothetical protein [Rhizobium leucaenae]